MTTIYDPIPFVIQKILLVQKILVRNYEPIMRRLFAGKYL